MQTRLNPYIGFRDDARQAMEFYKKVFGGTLTMSTFNDMDSARRAGAGGEGIMHAMLETPGGLVLMASDMPAGMEHRPGTSVSLSLSGDNASELKGFWEKLTEGAGITMPLASAPWGDTFGMLTDRFGIVWMVNISAPKS